MLDRRLAYGGTELNRKRAKKAKKHKKSIQRTPKPIPSLSQFLAQSWEVLTPGQELQWGWFLDLICEYLEALLEGELDERHRNLLLNMPPRHLKTTLVSIVFPCWCWLRYPSLRFLCLSYSASLANGHNQQRRKLIQSEFYQGFWSQGLRLVQAANRISEFENEYQGAMVSRGLDGSVTGLGGDLLIFDDPNNPEADDPDSPRPESGVQRHRALHRFQDFSATRKNHPQAPILVVQQRTHVGDISGWILENARDRYNWLKLPTVAQEEEAIEYPLSGDRTIRTPGDYLHPERFGEEEEQEARLVLGNWLFAARHQQSPMPLGGGLINIGDFPRYTSKDLPKHWDTVVQSWDTAHKGQEINDPWVCLTFGVSQGHFYLLEAFRKRLDYPEGKRYFLSKAREWEPATIICEQAATGYALQQECASQVRATLVPSKPTKDKVSRLAIQAGFIEQGRVWLPKQAPWLEEFEQELANFPKSLHDDQVDALSQFLAETRRIPLRSMRTPVKSTTLAARKQAKEKF
jgi:predicted phage terminase large subunit-like protein